MSATMIYAIAALVGSVASLVGLFIHRRNHKP